MCTCSFSFFNYFSFQGCGSGGEREHAHRHTTAQRKHTRFVFILSILNIRCFFVFVFFRFSLDGYTLSNENKSPLVLTKPCSTLSKQRTNQIRPPPFPTKKIEKKKKKKTLGWQISSPWGVKTWKLPAKWKRIPPRDGSPHRSAPLPFFGPRPPRHQVSVILPNGCATRKCDRSQPLEILEGFTTPVAAAAARDFYSQAPNVVGSSCSKTKRKKRSIAKRLVAFWTVARIDLPLYAYRAESMAPGRHTHCFQDCNQDWPTQDPYILIPYHFPTHPKKKKKTGCTHTPKGYAT